MLRKSIVMKLVRARTTRILCVLGFGLALTACDRCGDFVSPIKLHMQACRDEAPVPH